LYPCVRDSIVELRGDDCRHPRNRS
jgi:hypothetical protein